MSGRKAASAKAGAIAAVRPPAQPATSPGGGGDEASATALRLAAAIEAALAGDAAGLPSEEALQALIGAACRAYAARIEAGESFPPIAARSVTSTDVMVTASGLLKAANLAVFELGMWQSWTGR